PCSAHLAFILGLSTGAFMAKKYDDDDDFDDRDDDYEPPRRSSRRTESGSGVADFLTFRSMLVPIIIQVLFWLGVVIFVIGGIVQATQMRDPAIGIAMVVLGPFIWRIYCELLIVIFRINETLTAIKNELERQGRR